MPLFFSVSVQDELARQRTPSAKVVVLMVNCYCGMCRPIFEQHAGKAGGLQFAKVDVDANEETSAA